MQPVVLFLSENVLHDLLSDYIINYGTVFILIRFRVDLEMNVLL